MLSVLVIGLGGLLAVNEYAGAKQSILSDYAVRTKEFEKAFRDATAAQLQMLKLAVNIEARDVNVIEALANQDRAAIAGRETAFFNDVLKQQFNISLFNFLTPDKVIFYRVHSPSSFGDDASKRRMVSAALTERSSMSGMEVGRSGPQLRSMMPVSKGDVLVGGIEVGTELTRALQTAFRVTGLDYAFGVNRKLAESLGRNYDEETDVIQGEEMFSDFSTPQARRVLQDGPTGDLSETPKILSPGGRPILASSFSVADVDNRPVARFILLHDFGAALNATYLRTWLTFGSATAVVLLLCLVGFLRFQQIRAQFADTIAGRRRELKEKAEAYDVLAASLRDVQAWKRSVILQIVSAVAEPVRAISGAVRAATSETGSDQDGGRSREQLAFADAELRRLDDVIQAHEHTERLRSELGPVVLTSMGLRDVLKEGAAQADRGHRVASVEVLDPIPAQPVLVEPKLLRDAVSGLIEMLWQDCRADAVTVEVGAIGAGILRGSVSGVGAWPDRQPVIDTDGVSVVRALENPAVRPGPLAATFAAMVLSRSGGTIEAITEGRRVGYSFSLRLAS